MSKAGFVIHIKDEAAVKELMSLIRGTLAGGYDELMSQLGIQSEQIWLAQTRQGPALMVILEADDPAAVIREFMKADDPPISVWLRKATADSIDLDDALKHPMELVLDVTVG